MSIGFIFRTQGCPNIYLIPPKEPNLFLGSFINNPSSNILISPERSTWEGKSISSFFIDS